MIAMELVLVNGFNQEKLFVLYFVMEEPEPYIIHVKIKVRKMKNGVRNDFLSFRTSNMTQPTNFVETKQNNRLLLIDIKA